MSENKYGEPWVVEVGEPDFDCGIVEIKTYMGEDAQKDDHMITICENLLETELDLSHVDENEQDDWDEDDEPTIQRIKRAAACVNALAGIPDPAAFVAAAREHTGRIALLERQVAALCSIEADCPPVNPEQCKSMNCRECLAAWSLAKAKEGK